MRALFSVRRLALGKIKMVGGQNVELATDRMAPDFEDMDCLLGKGRRGRAPLQQMIGMSCPMMRFLFLHFVDMPIQ